MTKMVWTPLSWQLKKDAQPIQYIQQKELVEVTQKLQTLPPLVTIKEVDALKGKLRLAGEGQTFIIQGGDCAERFSSCNEKNINEHVQLMLQMALVISCQMGRTVTKVSRIAGQYTKPRSSAFETKEGKSLPSYRGDLVNAIEFSEKARKAEPKRLMRGYQCASVTLNYLRALSDSYRDPIENPEKWRLQSSLSDRSHSLYEDSVNRVTQALQMIKSLRGSVEGFINEDPWFVSHEALNLPFESALTRKCPHTQSFYNLSTHLPWVGMRTALPESAHIEFASGIKNPVGVKVGPKMTADWLKEILQKLNPDNELGKVVLIHRFGHNMIGRQLPLLIDMVKKSNSQVVWLCDPMHGNTKIAKNGYKTRCFNDIYNECKLAFDIHRECGTILGGLHLEMTGAAVTECVGGPSQILESQLMTNYQSSVDPRLNYQQAMELAALLSSDFKLNKTSLSVMNKKSG